MQVVVTPFGGERAGTSDANAAAAAHPRRRRRAPEKKKVTLVLPVPVYEELVGLAEDLGRNFAETIRWTLSLARAVAREFRSGHRVVVLQADGTFIKEFLYPR